MASRRGLLDVEEVYSAGDQLEGLRQIQAEQQRKVK